MGFTSSLSVPYYKLSLVLHYLRLRTPNNFLTQYFVASVVGGCRRSKQDRGRARKVRVLFLSRGAAAKHRNEQHRLHQQYWWDSRLAEVYHGKHLSDFCSPFLSHHCTACWPSHKVSLYCNRSSFGYDINHCLHLQLPMDIFFAICFRFLRNGKDDVSGVDSKSDLQLFIATFNHMRHPYQLLIIPLTIWSGVEQGFFQSDYTAVSTQTLLSLAIRQHLFQAWFFRQIIGDGWDSVQFLSHIKTH